MASIHVPAPTPDVLVPERTHRLRGLVVPVVLLSILALALISGFRWLNENLAVTGAPVEQPEPQAVIRPGNGPAVAATARGRIVSVECRLDGPIEVAPDGTGAFLVTSGLDNVRCPDGRFREGNTLRWPVAHPPATRPVSD